MTDAPFSLWIKGARLAQLQARTAHVLLAPALHRRALKASELLTALPELAPAPRPAPTPAFETCDDPLRAIEPAVYVKALMGADPGHGRKISCPLHAADRTPSLHVCKAPDDGWYCFGCRRGGSVYDLAAPLLGLSTRGRDFVELRERLYELLLPGREPPATPRHGRRGHAASARKSRRHRPPIWVPREGTQRA